MKIKKIICFSIFSFFSLIYSMDTPPKQDSQKKDLTLDHSGEVHIDIVQKKSDPKSKEEKRKSIVPDLNFFAMQQNQGGTNSSEGQRTPVETLGVLKKAISKKPMMAGRNGVDGATTRRLMTISRATRSVERDPGFIGDIEDIVPHKAPSLLPKAVPKKKVSGRFLLGDDQSWYSEEDLWKKLVNFNPPLCAFGQKHNMDLDELEEYAILMQELDINPRAITEYTHQNTPQREAGWFDQSLAYLFRESKQQHLDRLHKDYDKIKKENPDNYKVLILELIKLSAEEVDGVQGRSLIADTHTTMLGEQIAEKDESLRKQMLANILQFLLTVGTTAWALYGQIGATACPVNCTTA